MIYYLSGKITDETRDKELVNIANFFAVENELLRRGFNVFNPARLEDTNRSWEQYLAEDLKWIYENKPVLYMLPGWQESRGAMLEYEFAKLLGLVIISPM